jgi:hypothetical protein
MNASVNNKWKSSILRFSARAYLHTPLFSFRYEYWDEWASVSLKYLLLLHTGFLVTRKTVKRSKENLYFVMRLDFSFFFFFFCTPLCCPSHHSLVCATVYICESHTYHYFFLKDELPNRSVIYSLLFLLLNTYFVVSLTQKKWVWELRYICECFNIRCHVFMRYFLFTTLTKKFSIYF